jgi:2-polyprenyl-3-methyl-5-hydroxy-6-metoxy-1,4-benzoquinol methylase
LEIHDDLWINKWSIEKYSPIVEKYNGIIVGTDNEPRASLCMASFSEAMGEYFKEKMNILDYGCGGGRYCNFLSKRLKDFNYVGIEKYGSNYTDSCINESIKFFGEDSRVKFGYTNSELEKKAMDNCEIVLLLSVFTHTTIETTSNILEKLKPIVDRGGIIIFSMILADEYSLVGEAYGFDDNYTITYNTKDQIEDLKNKLKVKINLIGDFNTDENILHSIYRVEKLKVNYIIASYFGPRRRIDYNYIDDRFFYLRKHLNKLKTLKTTIEKIILVINIDNYFVEEDFNYFISDYKDMKIDIIKRENKDYSYGAWNDILKIYNDCDFSFLIEDDYVPTIDYFEKYFLKYFEKNTAYVCELYGNDELNIKMHARISNGIINNHIFNEVGGFVLHSSNCFNYLYAGEDQVDYLDNFINKGYEIKDISEEYKIPFEEHTGDITYYGNKNGIDIISPIMKSDNDIDVFVKDEKICIASKNYINGEIRIKNFNGESIYFDKLYMFKEYWVKPDNNSFLMGFFIEITDNNKSIILKRKWQGNYGT